MRLGDQLFQALRRGADDGLMAAAREVVEQAKANMPVGDPAEDPDPGVNLRDAISIERSITGDIIISVDAPHAAKQHEDQRLKHPRGGGPKYLERAVTQIAPTLDRIVASKVDAETATGRLSDPRRSHHRKGR